MRQLFTHELSPINTIPQDHLFVLIKGYFDGGNEANSTQYQTVTLASIVGRLSEWRPFDRAWNKVLVKHRANYLHTTDAVYFQNDFATGWDENRRDVFISDCATVLRSAVIELNRSVPVKAALIPYTATIVLADFKRIQTDVPSGPQDATEVLALSSAHHAIKCFELFGGHFLQLYYDRNEPFIGHIKDRQNHRKFRRDTRDRGFDFDRIVHLGEADMRFVPALQAADLLAYCVGHSNDVRFSWQDQVLKMDRMRAWYDYPTLRDNLDLDTHNLNISKYRFPRRRATR